MMICIAHIPPFPPCRPPLQASTMCILSTRRFGQSEAAAFSAALSGNTSLTELLASGHPLEVAGAAAFGEALSRNTTLRSLCVGDSDFGDEVRVVSQKRRVSE